MSSTQLLLTARNGIPGLIANGIAVAGAWDTQTREDDAPLMSAASVASSLQRIGPDWLTAVLHEGGHSEAIVERVVLEPLEVTGATTDIARVRISYDRAGEAGPPTLIAKIRGATAIQRRMDQAMGLFAREAQFYRTFASDLPVRTPACAYIGDGDDAPLLLEDLGGLRTENQIEGMRIADAGIVMVIAASATVGTHSKQ